MKVTCGELISVATGKLCCPLERVYELMNYLTGDSLYTHQLPRAFRKCESWVRSQHPWLRGINHDECTPETWREWLAAIVAQHGDEFDLAPLPAGRWESVDPVQEAVELMEGRDNVVVVKT